MTIVRRFPWVLFIALLMHGPAYAGGTFTRTLLGPPEPVPWDGFARSTTSVGDRLVVGAPGFVSFGPGTPGRVFVMDARGQVDFIIENPTPDARDEFGAAVAIVGDDILVGAQSDDAVGTDGGAAYLFDGATGALLQTFTVPGTAGHRCGGRVAGLAGNALVQCDGAYLFDPATGAVLRHFTTPTGYSSGGFATFAADVILTDSTNAYRLDGSTGAIVTTYADPDPLGGLNPGDIAQLGSTVVIGRGSRELVYVFDGDTGALLNTIEGAAFGTQSNERFGQAVATIGDEIVVSGSLVLYRYDGVTYDQVDRFFSEDMNRTASADEVSTVFGTSYANRVYDPAINDGRGRLFLFDRCGNGIHTGGEQCDDGNNVGGDGCSPTCHLELCPPTPITTGCHELTLRSKSTLKLRSHRQPAWSRNNDKLSWQWHGAATSLADFGNPTNTASYQLCLYGNTVNTPDLVMDPAALAGNGWTAEPDRMLYRNPSKFDDGQPSGIGKIQLRAGADGRASISLTGAGFRLGLPAPVADGGPLPFGPGITVILHNNETGACWAADYGNVKNSKGELKTIAFGS